MSAGSTKFTVSRIAALSLVSLWLAGCTNTNNPPAPVSSAGGAASSSTNSGMLITPPPSGVKSTPQAQPIQPMQTQTIQPQPAPVAQEPVQTVNGRIVYNRKYGDIPKGSYTGGSTYTVKRGDTAILYRLGHRQRFPRPGATQQYPGPVRAERGAGTAGR
ncbi:lipoprotein NlpD [Klebsiella pneumoniae]|uniref:Lipoprotein NlpD n=1 Tax=Klebsiella pneumoniae TaxID=573 RepID=A0A378FR06_KLEPN|nr:lipoprotein NlpD [Klebsiella pneumoniae]